MGWKACCVGEAEDTWFALSGEEEAERQLPAAPEEGKGRERCWPLLLGYPWQEPREGTVLGQGGSG